MVFDRETTARRAEQSTRFGVGMCQLWVRTMAGGESAGDNDRDGDADAVDGWKREPVSARHSDRKPPRGVPVAFSGGSRGFGHRAISLGNGKLRSTDMTGTRYTPGIVGTTTISEIEGAMGVRYVGWSDTISGVRIPVSVTQEVKPLRVHGVDISRHQGRVKIKWDKLQDAGVKWMYHKCSEGVSFRDEFYAPRRTEAKHAGMPFGAYHFARPNPGDAKSEARAFIEAAAPEPTDLRPALDLETKEFVSGDLLIRWADAFCEEVERLVGVVPVVYTPYILSKELEDRAIFWVPRYNNSNIRPVRDWDIFQFSNGVLGKPNQVAGYNWDLNYAPHVSLAELRLDKPAPVPNSRGRRIDLALEQLILAEKRAPEGTKRDNALEKAIQALKNLKPRFRKD
jgi:hypothetical protein